MEFDGRVGECLEDDRDAEIIRMARATSEGVMPFDDFVRELEALRGERLVPAVCTELPGRAGEWV